MKSNQYLLLAVALFAAGCGQDLSGTYRGRERILQSGYGQVGYGQMPNEMDATLTLANGDSDQSTVTISDTYGAGSGTAHVTDNSITIDRVDMNCGSFSGTGIVAGGNIGTYSGTGSIDNNKLLVTLSLQNSGSTTGPNGQQQQQFSSCPQSRTLDLTKQD